MKKMIISLASSFGRAAKAIGRFFKVIFVSLWQATKYVSIKIAFTVKAISLFIWRNFLSYVFQFFIKVFRLLYAGIKFVVIKIASGIKIVSIFLWQYILKYIYLFFKYTFIYLGIALHFIGKNIYKGLLNVYRFIRDHIIKHIISALKIVFDGIKRFSINFLKVIQHIARWLWLNVFKHVIWFIKQIYLAFKFLVIKIGKLIKYIAIFIWRYMIKHIIWFFKQVYKGIYFILNKIYIGTYILFRFIWQVIFVNIGRFFKKAWIVLKRSVVFILKGIKYMSKSTPEILHHFFMLIFLYFLLIIHFIIFELLKYLVYTMPVFIIKHLYKVAKQLFHIIYKFIRLVSTVVYNGLKRIFGVISKVFNRFRDYLEYYYIVLLSPIIVPIFILMFALATIKLLLIFISISIKTLFGYPILERNEVIYVKTAYHPGKNIFRNVIAFNNNLKYNYTFSIKFKRTWFLVNMIVWELIYLLILASITYILFLPVTLISLIIRKDVDVSSRIIVVNKKINGQFKFKKVTVFGKKVSARIENEILVDNYTQQRLIKNQEDQFLKLSVYADNQKISSYKFLIQPDLGYQALRAFNLVKKELLNTTYYQFTLPVLQDDNLIVKYEKNWNRDTLLKTAFKLRNFTTKTSLNVLIHKSDGSLILEQDVTISNLVNPAALIKLSKSNKVLNIRTGEFITDKLDRKYRYLFEETSKVTKDGQVISIDDEVISVSVAIEGFETYQYKLKVNVIADYQRLDEYIEVLKNNFLDFENSRLHLLDIKRMDGTYKKVDWYIHHSIVETFADTRKLFDFVLSDSKIKVYVMFVFNGKYVNRKIEIDVNLYQQTDYLVELFNHKMRDTFKIVTDKDMKIMPFKKWELLNNQYYIDLPILGTGKLLFLRWISADKSKIKSTGKIISDDFKYAEFKVVCYYGLWIRKTFKVTIINIT